MPLNSVLPSVEHLIVIALLNINASLVLNLRKLGGTLFVHAILQVASHRAITLAYLAKHISLMRLLFIGCLEGFLLMSPVLSVNLCINLLLVVIFKPVSFIFQSLFQQDVLLTVLVDVLK